METLISKCRYKNEVIEGLKKDFAGEIKFLKASTTYISEIYHTIFKAEFAEKWKSQYKKSACPYECFNSIDDYQKPVNNLKKRTSSVI